jgi:hypothetical protein
MTIPGPVSVEEYERTHYLVLHPKVSASLIAAAEAMRPKRDPQDDTVLYATQPCC